MGKAVKNVADSAGLDLIPMPFGYAKEAGKTVEECGKEIKVHGPSDRERVVALVYCEHLNMIVVDYTMPVAVNRSFQREEEGAAELRLWRKPGGERTRDRRSEGSSVKEKGAISASEQSKSYLFETKKEKDEEGKTEKMRMSAVVGAVKVMESHQSSELDTSGTAKAVISYFEKLGASFDMYQIQQKAGQRIYNMIDVLPGGGGWWARGGSMR
ncbi:4-hydroxy-tetrahydrodipicolinate reductase 2, chloroplastic-like [Eucalyptus grandis]|uniref:4-hydroxy-tetrahydrodipicolinate reductase 2, chloroplastic-like n=1 Tax=Eucalyptus grandis TaxID=71139 RepID=UPI00192EA5E0|nr:4-hydroxy-tetrahydrodipicolinate reductase 2, chloroplastic-like [Eucalyptus grandis]